MDVNQFSRSEMILGKDSTTVLKLKKIIIFGLGGVGSYAAEAVARAGVGNITLVDGDFVSVTNINRQLCALHSTVGLPKTEVIKSRIKDINPDCNITVIDKFVFADDLEDFNLTSYDYIIDAIDSVSVKIRLAELSFNCNIPLISAMGTGNKIDPSQFRISDIKYTTNCPLCRVMRRELKSRGITRLNVVWSPEIPVKPSETEEITQKRSVPGSLPFVPGAAGLIMAGRVITDLIKG